MNRAKIFIAFTFLLAFAVCVSAQNIQFPNELKGYEFYNQGKLKDLKLKTSTSEDVIAIFGNDCFVGGCEYNEDWEVGFVYYLDWMKRNKTENGVENTYTVSPEFVGRIYTILLFPKKSISFNQITFSKVFQTDTFLGQHSIELKSYSDRKGLDYIIYSDNNLKYIQYNVPEDFERDMFILTQIQDKPFSY